MHEKDPMDDSVSDFLAVQGKTVTGNLLSPSFLFTCKRGFLTAAFINGTALKTNGHHSSVKIRFDQSDAVDRTNWFGTELKPEGLMVDEPAEAVQIAASMLRADTFLIQVEDTTHLTGVAKFDVTDFAKQVSELPTCAPGIKAAPASFISRPKPTSPKSVSVAATQ
jgi:hypothetical protein